MAFGIFTCCFAKRPYYYFCSFLTLPHFKCQLASFNSTLIHVLRKFLRLGYLKCLKIPLCRRQASFSISRGKICLVFGEVITLTTYLGSQGFVASIIIFKFQHNDHSFYWGILGPTTQVHFHSRFTLGGFMTFYVKLFKFASFHLSNSQREKQIVFKITFWKNCMHIHFPISVHNCLLIVIALN